MDGILILWLCISGVMAVFSTFAMYKTWRKKRELDAWWKKMTGWVETEKRHRETLWSPDFLTSSSNTSLTIRLVRVDVSPTGRSVLNTLEIGEVELTEEGWEKKVEELTLSAREQMNNLNAFIQAHALRLS